MMWQFEDCFGSFKAGFFTMFSVQAGDALYDTYYSMKECGFFYAIFFMYVFIFFVVSIVQNIFMCIVEDSYIQIKYKKNFEWLAGTEHENGVDPQRSGPGGNDDGGPPPN